MSAAELHLAPFGGQPANDTALMHSSPIPGYPFEKTLCGTYGPAPYVFAEITCPECIEILGDASRLHARANELEALYGAPKREGEPIDGD